MGLCKEFGLTNLEERFWGVASSFCPIRPARTDRAASNILSRSSSIITVLLVYEVRLDRLPVYQLESEFFSTLKSMESGYHLTQFTFSIFDDEETGNIKRASNNN